MTMPNASLGSPINAARGFTPKRASNPRGRQMRWATSRGGAYETERNPLPPPRRLTAGMPAQRRLIEPVVDHQSLAPSVRKLVESDGTMAGLVASVGPYALRTQTDPWLVLASAVIYQQVSGRVAAGMVSKLRGLSGGTFPAPGAIQRLSPDAYRFVGLTHRKEQTLRRLAEAIERGELDLAVMSGWNDQRITEALCAWSGVGPWTAHMFLVFHLGREDVIMPGDLGIRKAIARYYGLENEPTPDEVLEISQRWAPVRTIASWYLWKSIPGFPEPGLG